MDPHAMPPESFEYDRCYLSPVESRTEKETRERYRQRAFSMYCWHGSFPPILNSWATRNELPVGLTGFDVNERFKKTGDYHIFRSEVSANGKPFPHCEVICVGPFYFTTTEHLHCCQVLQVTRTSVLDQFSFAYAFHSVFDSITDFYGVADCSPSQR